MIITSLRGSVVARLVRGKPAKCPPPGDYINMYPRVFATLHLSSPSYYIYIYTYKNNSNNNWIYVRIYKYIYIRTHAAVKSLDRVRRRFRNKITFRRHLRIDIPEKTRSGPRGAEATATKKVYNRAGGLLNANAIRVYCTTRVVYSIRTRTKIITEKTLNVRRSCRRCRNRLDTSGRLFGTRLKPLRKSRHVYWRHTGDRTSTINV